MCVLHARGEDERRVERVERVRTAPSLAPSALDVALRMALRRRVGRASATRDGGERERGEQRRADLVLGRG